MTLLRTAFLALCCMASVSAHPSGARAQTIDADMFSNNAWGSRGGFHLQAARLVRPGTVAMTIGDTFTSGSSVFAAGDSLVQSTLKLSVLWSPYEGIEIGLSQVSVVGRYDDVLSSSLQLQGNPTLLVKYVAPLGEDYGLGGYATVSVPTSEGGKGLDTGALTLRLVGVGSYRVHENIDLTANVGYIYDRSNHLFGTAQASSLSRYIYGIDNSSNRATYGIGGTGILTVDDAVGLSPFVEFWGEYAGGVALAQNPFAATVGVKAFPPVSRAVEGLIGVDVRLAGEPHVNAAPAGLPSWLVFAQVSLRFGESKEGLGKIWVPRCDVNKPCEEGHMCEGFACVKVQEVVHEKVVMQDVAKPVESINLSGGAFDSESGQPLAGTQIFVTGQPGAMTVDPATGKFNLWPLLADGGLVKITARALGYEDSEQTVSRSKTAEQTPLTFRLRPTGSRVTGTFNGSVRDGSTGELIKNVSIFVPAAGVKIPLQSDGSFTATLNVGQYQMLVSAPGYETQKKDVRVQSDQVVILDIDLHPKKGKKTEKTEKPGKRRP